jgi:ribosome-associated protein
MNQVFINKESVELYKILKFEGIRSSGAEAKAMIAEGGVKLNGEFETRKRKQIVAGDVIECDGETYQVQLEG